jgi:hypothetical protein
MPRVYRRGPVCADRVKGKKAFHPTQTLWTWRINRKEKGDWQERKFVLGFFGIKKVQLKPIVNLLKPGKIKAAIYLYLKTFPFFIALARLSKDSDCPWLKSPLRWELERQA